jgi:RNA polymerase sigma-70 factor (ECF subfamily)
MEQWTAFAEPPGPVRSAIDEAVLLHTLVDDLDADRRDAFVLTQVLDLSYAEAADVCRCPIGTIRSRVARAREDLIAAMDTRPPLRSRHVDGA